MKKLISCFFVGITLLSCSDKDKLPSGILEREKMQEVMWDMISASEYLNSRFLGNDSIDKTAESQKIYGQTLRAHRITREQFDKSYSYYRLHPELMKTVLDSLSKKQINTQPLPRPGSDSVRKKVINVEEVK